MNAFDKDFEEALSWHELPLPKAIPKIEIADARQVLGDCFRWFLAKQGSDFVWLKAYEEVADWLSNNRRKGLFLHGDCGLGKSQLTRFVLPAILLKYTGKVCRVYDVRQMNRALDEVLRRRVVALDDIGTESVINDFGNKRLAFAEIVDNAEKNGVLLIVSTNLNADALKELYGTRVVERIIATTRRVQFAGKSLRR